MTLKYSTGELIEVGDVVKLNSSSTKMTVHAISMDTNEVECRWFDETNTLFEAAFYPDELKFLMEAEHANGRR